MGRGPPAAKRVIDRYAAGAFAERYSVAMRVIEEMAGCDAAVGRYRFARVEPLPRLRPFVREYMGYVDPRRRKHPHA